MTRELWTYMPRTIRWPDTIPSMRRQVLHESRARSYLRAVWAMPNRILNRTYYELFPYDTSETAPYRIGWHARYKPLWRGWRRPWQSEAPSTCPRARRALTALGAKRKMLRDVANAERDRVERGKVQAFADDPWWAELSVTTVHNDQVPGGQR